MKRSLLIGVVAAYTLSDFGFAPVRAEEIPPNCTLDPYTHKTNCPILPNCTLDPFTHTSNCHVRKAGTAALPSQSTTPQLAK